MTANESRIFVKEFRRFFLSEILFYNNLSYDNIILKEFEKYFNMGIEALYFNIKESPLDLDKIGFIKDFYRNILNIALVAECKKDSENMWIIFHKISMLEEKNA